MTTTAAELAQRLDAKPAGSGWIARCPAHDDQNPSLSISDGTDGKLLYHCHAGCTPDVVAAALGLGKGNGRGKSKATPKALRTAEPTAIYDYTDEADTILYQVLRYGNGPGKSFACRQPASKGGWIWNLEGVRRVPYRLPEILKASIIFIVEGEKDVDSLRELGLTATNSKNWQLEWCAYFRGKDVYVIADNDKPGLETAKKVVAAIAGEANSVRVIDLPDLPPGGDVSDFIEKHGEGAYDALLKLVEAPALEPEAQLSLKEDPIPLSDELSPVAPFDTALLPDKLRPWAEDIIERIGCPPDFVAIGIMAGLAAVTGRKIGVRPQARTDWTVIPNIWALAVGRPGVLKSPAIEATLAPLKRLAKKAVEQHVSELEEYKRQQKVVKLRAEAGEKAARKRLEKDPRADAADLLSVLSVGEVDAPVMRRYIANDTSSASLGELLRQNQNGLLVYRDELVSLLKGLDREDQADGRGFYLTGWNGDSSYTFDRIGRGFYLHIEAVCLSVLGGTQPGRLAEYIGKAVSGGTGDDGLIQRFGLLVWPDTSGTWRDIDRWPDNEAKNNAYGVYEHLDNIDTASLGAQHDTDPDGNPTGVPYLRLAPEALTAFQEWRLDLEGRLRSGDLHPAIESHLAKYRKLIPSLALIIHLADYGGGLVSKTAMLKALAWGEYLETHALRAYGAVSQPEIAAAKAILSRIKMGDLPHIFSGRDVQRHGWARLTDRSQIHGALELLVDHNWLDVEQKDDTGGRPATIYRYKGPRSEV